MEINPLANAILEMAKNKLSTLVMSGAVSNADANAFFASLTQNMPNVLNNLTSQYGTSISAEIVNMTVDNMINSNVPKQYQQQQQQYQTMPNQGGSLNSLVNEAMVNQQNTNVTYGSRHDERANVVRPASPEPEPEPEKDTIRINTNMRMTLSDSLSDVDMATYGVAKVKEFKFVEDDVPVREGLGEELMIDMQSSKRIVSCEGIDCGIVDIGTMRRHIVGEECQKSLDIALRRVDTLDSSNAIIRSTLGYPVVYTNKSLNDMEFVDDLKYALNMSGVALHNVHEKLHHLHQISSDHLAGYILDMMNEMLSRYLRLSTKVSVCPTLSNIDELIDAFAPTVEDEYTNSPRYSEVMLYSLKIVMGAVALGNDTVISHILPYLIPHLTEQFSELIYDRMEAYLMENNPESMYELVDEVYDIILLTKEVHVAKLTFPLIDDSIVKSPKFFSFVNTTKKQILVESILGKIEGSSIPRSILVQEPDRLYVLKNGSFLDTGEPFYMIDDSV